MFHIGVDEAGRGPLFGRVYSAAVILPNEDDSDSSFDFSCIKDSKKFSNKKKIKEVSDYIKENALYWGISHVSETIIDKKNIREATFICMHQAIKELISSLDEKSHSQIRLLIDGNAFKPYLYYNGDMFIEVPHTCIIGGDAIHKSIAAASILAKVARDEYIADMCSQHPVLIEKYDLLNNKGYGTKNHRKGIHKHGKTEWHRQSFHLHS